MIIGVDNGNCQTKTTHRVFVSGLTQHSVRPPLADEVIEYNGSFWTRSNDRLPYRRDKTQDEYCFVLTLFAIMAEIKKRSAVFPVSSADVTLAVGLPPQHYGALRERFAAYFAQRSPAVFKYNGNQVVITLNQVLVYPQAYAAVVSQATKVKEFSRLFVVDIGGYTTDVLLLSNGLPDLTFCHSLEMGTITMANRIMQRVSSLHDMTIELEHIQDVLSGRQTVLPKDVKDMIEEEVSAHAAFTLDKIREIKADLRSNPSIFLGGGAVMLRPFLEQSRMISQTSFLEDPRANALGYEMLAASQLRQMPRNGG